LQSISDKIKELKFQECKVRVLNVDSQASFDNILVSVIGEISNNSEPSRKFVQTFVLAEQPNGYYVLNDIFRYLVEETEEEPTSAAPVAEAPEAVAEVPAIPAEEAQVVDEAAVSKVDEKLEEVEANGEVEEPKEVAPQTNGTPAQEETPVAATPAIPAEDVNQEKPATPEPSPAPEKEEEEVPEKETAPTPAVPKTWANIATTNSFAAKAAAASKAAAAATPAASAAAAAPKAVAPAAQAAPSSQPAAQAAAAPAEATRSQEPSADAGWQTAGHDHKKSQPRAGEETVLAYIKNVNDKVDASILKNVLTRYGKLKYFDVSRPKVSFFFLVSLIGSVLIFSFTELRLC
jgi:hypothetical protein